MRKSIFLLIALTANAYAQNNDCDLRKGAKAIEGSAVTRMTGQVRERGTGRTLYLACTEGTVENCQKKTFVEESNLVDGHCFQEINPDLNFAKLDPEIYKERARLDVASFPFEYQHYFGFTKGNILLGNEDTWVFLFFPLCLAVDLTILPYHIVTDVGYAVSSTISQRKVISALKVRKNLQERKKTVTQTMYNNAIEEIQRMELVN